MTKSQEEGSIRKAPRRDVPVILSIRCDIKADGRPFLIAMTVGGTAVVGVILNRTSESKQ